MPAVTRPVCRANRPSVDRPIAIRSASPNRRPKSAALSRTPGRISELARDDVTKHQQQLQMALLHDVVRFLVEQPLAACDPPTRYGEFPGEQQHLSQPECAFGGVEWIRAVEVKLVGALQRLHAVVGPAGEIGRGCQVGEIVGVQRPVHRCRTAVRMP